MRKWEKRERLRDITKKAMYILLILLSVSVISLIWVEEKTALKIAFKLFFTIAVLSGITVIVMRAVNLIITDDDDDE